MKKGRKNAKKTRAVKNCNKMNARSCKNSSAKKITGFDESKSFELDDNEDSFNLK